MRCDSHKFRNKVEWFQDPKPWCQCTDLFPNVDSVLVSDHKVVLTNLSHSHAQSFLLSSRPESIQNLLSNASEGHIVASVTRVKEACHLVTVSVIDVNKNYFASCQRLSRNSQISLHKLFA